ncbi:uroporphyrinogen decarboxylase [Parvularcula marina]|uniref:uroporphyrinogen decarboxylase n=1 Tax=Parvularcula marina TaxID=2292771 RepID=UPI00351712CC
MSQENSKFMRVLRGEPLSIPPIWFMRQAGRYLPEYRAVREEAGGFLDLCYNPDKAARVTLQPIERFDLDAAILFADILLIPQALGMKLWFEQGEGPRLEPVLKDDMSAAGKLSGEDIHKTLSPVYETVSQVRAALPPEKALIGFAGAPWTVATYMLAGQGVKDPSALRMTAYQSPDEMAALIDLIASATAEYLIRQAQAGANAVMLFDSWAAGLPSALFHDLCVEPVRKIAAEVKAKTGIPVIGFPRGSGPAYTEVAKLKEIDAVSIDTGLPWDWAAENLSLYGAVQGGLDQLLLLEGGDALFSSADRLIDSFAGKPFIFNVGHGLIPQTPPEHVATLVKHIRER